MQTKMQITMWRTLFIISLSIILLSLLQQTGAAPAKHKSPKNQQQKSWSGDYIKDNSFKDQTKDSPPNENYKKYRSEDTYNIAFASQDVTIPRVSDPTRNGRSSVIYA